VFAIIILAVVLLVRLMDNDGHPSGGLPGQVQIGALAAN
jgi:hypothetical protein